jgi:NAD(P)-dependent dehydrogenase (short-subunit alcohol dehydrogenase family)
MGKVLIVTGGSRGIGAATCRLGAAQGYAVAVNYVSDGAAADRVVADIKAAGGQAVAVQGDVGREDDVMRLFETADEALGPVTALVNNAATAGGKPHTVEEMTAESVGTILAVNVTGSILCAREAVKRMSTRHGGGGGAIVNITSLASIHGAAKTWIDYAASKAALDTFTIGLAIEVAECGIRVNAVRPGLIDTEIHARSGMPDRVAKLAQRMPMKRAGQPEEVAHAALWLLSEEASYVSGAILDVTGAR